jgi:molecular chaperone GrpE
MNSNFSKNKSKNAPKIDAIQNKKIVKLEEKVDQLQNKLNRSLADYSNLEKRIESQRQLFVTLATTSLLSKIIEVLDDLYLSNQHLKNAGLKMVIDKFVSVLESEGIEEIVAEKQTFNPESMDCVEVAPGIQDEVVAVKKKGYRLNGHIIRPAQVIVGKESN